MTVRPPLVQRRRRWVVVVTSVLIVAPAVAAVLALVGRPWYPANDFAIIDLRVRDVFTAHTPLTGLQSRPGWSHPAPLMFWAIAPLSWAAGGAAWMTRVGGALLQAIALTWLAVVTARRGLRWLLMAGAVASLTYLASNHWLFREPWNPHVPLPFFVLFLFLAAFAAVGEFRQFIGMSIAAVMMVSTHISYVLPVLAGFAFAGVCTFVDVRRAHRAPDRWRSTVVLSVAVWFVALSAPLLDVVLHWPGNLGKIARYFAGAPHSTVGVGDALRYTADEYRWVPPWLGGAHRVQAFTGYAVRASVLWLLVPLALIVTGAIAVRLTRNRRDGRVLALATVMLIVSVVAIAGADEPRAYTFQWRAVVAAFLAVACAGSVSRLVVQRTGRRAPAARTVLVVVALGAIAWGSIAMTVAVVRRPSWYLSSREREVRLVDRVIQHRRVPQRPIRVRMVSGHSLYDGVVNELDRRGADVRVDPVFGRVFGTERAVPESTPLETWNVTEEGSKIPALLRLPGARVIFATTPLGKTEEAELAALQQKVGRQLDAAGRADLRTYLDSSFIGYSAGSVPGIARPDLLRLVALNGKVERTDACRCAVVAVPAGSGASAPP